MNNGNNESRYQQRPTAAEQVAQSNAERQKKTSSLRRMGMAGSKLYGHLRRLGGFAVLAGGVLLVADATTMTENPAEGSKWRPSTAIANFVGGTIAGIEDLTRAVDTKWQVITGEALAKIDRQTTAVTEEINTRASAELSRIEAVDRQIYATAPTNWFNQLACLYADVQRGAMGGGTCQNAENFREHVMTERGSLIGDVKVLYDDEELKEMIALDNDRVAEWLQ